MATTATRTTRARRATTAANPAKPRAARPGKPEATRRTFLDIPVRDLHPDPKNKREDYGDLDGLAESIKQHGVLTPLRVKPRPEGGYTIVFGERRYRACLIAKAATAPCEVTEDNDLARDVDRISENFHRKALTPVEEARELASLRDDHNLTQRQIAERVGMSQPSVQRRLSVLSLPDFAVAALLKGTITFDDGIELARIKDPKRVKKAMESGYIASAAAREVEAEAKEAKAAKAVAALRKAGIEVVTYPQHNSWTDRTEKPLGSFASQVNVAVDDHATEPCHAAAVSSTGSVVYLCTEPSRHVPAEGKKKAVGKPAKVAPVEETPTRDETPEQAAARGEREAEAQRQKAARHALTDAATARRDFVRSLLRSGRAPQAVVVEHVARVALDDPSRLAGDLLGLEDGADEDAVQVYAEQSKANFWRAALASALGQVEDLMPGGGAYRFNDALDDRERRYLTFLTTLGYEPTETEQALLATPEAEAEPTEPDDGTTWTGDETPDATADPSDAEGNETEAAEAPAPTETAPKPKKATPRASGRTTRTTKRARKTPTRAAHAA